MSRDILKFAVCGKREKPEAINVSNRCSNCNVRRPGKNLTRKVQNVAVFTTLFFMWLVRIPV